MWIKCCCSISVVCNKSDAKLHKKYKLHNLFKDVQFWFTHNSLWCAMLDYLLLGHYEWMKKLKNNTFFAHKDYYCVIFKLKYICCVLNSRYRVSYNLSIDNIDKRIYKICLID